MKRLAIKLGKMTSILALAITAMNVNSVCMLFAHHPEEAKKLRKF
jgi:cyclic lactone autoinducer peptide